MALKTLDQAYDEQWKRHAQVVAKPAPLGIACPKCGAELMNPNPNEILASFPPQVNAQCPTCHWKGFAPA